MPEPKPPTNYQDVIDGFTTLEAALGAPAGSLVSLLTDEDLDDWSFVIRAHAIVEGAVSQMLSAALDKRLRPVFERLELGRSDTGKLEFAKALNLLTVGQRQFIRMLSGIRNKLAHDLRHLDFTFDKHLCALDKQQRDNFFDAITHIMPAENRDALRILAHEAPRAVIAANIQALVKEAVEGGSFAEISREEAELALRQVIKGELIYRDDT